MMVGEMISTKLIKSSSPGNNENSWCTGLDGHLNSTFGSVKQN